MLGTEPSDPRYFVISSFDLSGSLCCQTAVHPETNFFIAAHGVCIATDTLEGDDCKIGCFLEISSCQSPFLVVSCPA